MIFLLAMLSVGTANGLPNASAKRHHRTLSATSAHKPATAAHRKTRHSAHHAAGRVSALKTGQTRSRQHAAKRGSVRAASHMRALRSHQAARFHQATNLHPRTEIDGAERPAMTEDVSLGWERFVMPPPLRGSYESLVRQNERSEADGLERIEDDEDLDDHIARKMLVQIPVSAALTVNRNLPENRRYCRPWTARFLADLALAHAAEFHSPLEVNSAVRTVAYQKQLMKINGNAAPAEGDIASPHLTGATIDIAKDGLSPREIAWMRIRLLRLQLAGKIDVEEEFEQACFHITVYKSYLPHTPALRSTGQTMATEERTGRNRASR
jgi:hypothetical protein